VSAHTTVRVSRAARFLESLLESLRDLSSFVTYPDRSETNGL